MHRLSGFECAVCGRRRSHRLLILREHQAAYRSAFCGWVGGSGCLPIPTDLPRACGPPTTSSVCRATDADEQRQQPQAPARTPSACRTSPCRRLRVGRRSAWFVARCRYNRVGALASRELRVSAVETILILCLWARMGIVALMSPMTMSPGLALDPHSPPAALLSAASAPAMVGDQEVADCE